MSTPIRMLLRRAGECGSAPQRATGCSAEARRRPEGGGTVPVPGHFRMSRPGTCTSRECRRRAVARCQFSFGPATRLVVVASSSEHLARRARRSYGVGLHPGVLIPPQRHLCAILHLLSCGRLDRPRSSQAVGSNQATPGRNLQAYDIYARTLGVYSGLARVHSSGDFP